MPELPDVVVYLESLAPRVLGRTLDRVRIINPSVLRSVEPAVSDAEGREVWRMLGENDWAGEAAAKLIAEAR